jgi:multiple sugar transport system permease protein
MRRHALPWALIAPAVVLVGAGAIYPIAYVIWLSGYDYQPYRGGLMVWVGGGNLARVIADATFWHSLSVSAIWVGGSVIPQFMLGLGMALVLNESFRGRGLVRTIILAPWAVSGVVTGIIWLWVFDGTIGVVNDLLLRAGVVDFPVAWGIHEETTWLMLLLANAWRGAPFFAIVLLAALQSIEPELYEAAHIDGASATQRFRHVTLPLILDAVVVSTLLRALWTFNFIDLILTMTRGGPIDATKTLPIYIFDVAYQRGEFGYAAALSVALCMVLVAFSAAWWQLRRLGGR